MSEKKVHVIIGASAAGIGAINKIRSLDQTTEIIWITDETEMPYNKCLLADFLDNTKELAQVFTRDAVFIEQHNIQLLRATRVVEIDAQEQTIKIEKKPLVPSEIFVENFLSRDATEISYSTLLIATGTRTKKLDVPGANLAGVFTYQTLSDALQIKKYVQEHNAPKVAIIGAGLSGLECADALHNLGCGITLVEAQSRLLPMFLDEQGSRFLFQKIQEKGISVLLQQTVKEIVGKNNYVTGLALSSGAQLQMNIVICALGTIPNSEFIKSSDIKSHRGFILVDEFQRTTQKNIFAAGDVTMVRNQLTGELAATNRWSDAVLQGMVAGCNMVGEEKKYPGIIPWSSSSFFGVRFIAGGACVHTGQNEQLAIQLTEIFLQVIQKKEGAVSGFYLLSCGPVDVSVYKNMLLKK